MESSGQFPDGHTIATGPISIPTGVYSDLTYTVVFKTVSGSYTPLGMSMYGGCEVRYGAWQPSNWASVSPFSFDSGGTRSDGVYYKGTIRMTTAGSSITVYPDGSATPVYSRTWTGTTVADMGNQVSLYLRQGVGGATDHPEAMVDSVKLEGTLASSPPPVEWKTQDGGNGHKYEVVLVDGGISWEQARDAAIARGGHLATISSAAENDFVFNLAKDASYWAPYAPYNVTGGPWLGGYRAAGQSDPASGWTWVTGEPWTYQGWAPGAPNNLGENYLQFFTGGSLIPSSGWNDAFLDTAVVAGVSNVSYVVEYDVPEPATISLLVLAGLGLLNKRHGVKK